MTAPPRNAPRLLPMLRAEWLTAAASVWLSPATSISRVWIAGRERRRRAADEEHADEEADGSTARSARAPASDDRERAEADEDRAQTRVVGEAAADEVADRHADAATTSTNGTNARRQTGDLGRHRGDVAVDGEEPAEADRRRSAGRARPPSGVNAAQLARGSSRAGRPAAAGTTSADRDERSARRSTATARYATRQPAAGRGR